MDKVYAPATLQAAWDRVRADRGAAGVDGVSLERFAARSGDALAELSAALLAGTYRPQLVRRVEVPKGDGRLRPLGIPAVEDRPRAGLRPDPMNRIVRPAAELVMRTASWSCAEAARRPVRTSASR